MTSNTETEPAQMKRGINIGNSLDSPKGYNWGVVMNMEYFDHIKDAGFDTVRLPVRFSDYTDNADNKLDESFMLEVDGYIEHALSLGLTVIIDLHHFDELMDDPEKNRSKLINIWEQLSARYKDYPDELVFEILNEPRGLFAPDMWNVLLSELIETVRKDNPDRRLIVCSVLYYTIEEARLSLEALRLPADDNNLIYTFHYYFPPEFTFQGNEYHIGYEDLHDIKWTGNPKEKALMRKHFEQIRDWAEKNGVQVMLGEFGVVNTVPFEYRGKWVQYAIELSEELGFSWCYWELGSWFGIFDIETMTWDEDMLGVMTKR